MRRGAHPFGIVREHYGAAHGLEVAKGLELFAHRDDIEGCMLVHELAHRLEDHLVLLVVEAVPGEFRHRRVDDGGFEQHCAEHGLLRLQGLRGFVPYLEPEGVKACLRLAA